MPGKSLSLKLKSSSLSSPLDIKSLSVSLSVKSLTTTLPTALKWIKLHTSNGSWLGSREPCFLALNVNSSKMAKSVDFKLDMHVRRHCQEKTPKNFFGKEASPELVDFLNYWALTANSSKMDKGMVHTVFVRCVCMHVCQAGTSCALSRWQHFSTCVMAAILKV